MFLSFHLNYKAYSSKCSVNLEEMYVRYHMHIVMYAAAPDRQLCYDLLTDSELFTIYFSLNDSSE